MDEENPINLLKINQPLVSGGYFKNSHKKESKAEKN